MPQIETISPLSPEAQAVKERLELLYPNFQSLKQLWERDLVMLKAWSMCQEMSIMAEVFNKSRHSIGQRVRRHTDWEARLHQLTTRWVETKMQDLSLSLLNELPNSKNKEKDVRTIQQLLKIKIKEPVAEPKKDKPEDDDDTEINPIKMSAKLKAVADA
jgi:hypothetical protein